MKWVARSETSPTETSPRTHSQQTVARWALTQKTVARPDSNLTGQEPTNRSLTDISPIRHTPKRTIVRTDINPNGHWPDPTVAQSLCPTQHPNILHIHVLNSENVNSFIYLITCKTYI